MNTPRHRQRIRGFTLLEIIIVLSLAGLLTVAAVVVMGGSDEEEKLRTQLGKIENFAQLARANSVNYQIAFAVTLEEGQVSLGPLNTPRRQIDEEIGGGGGGLPSVLSQTWPKVEKIDADYQMEVFRWGTEKGVLMEGSKKEVWIFQPGGLCEPVSVRLFKDDGDISLKRAFHPLTAMAEDEEKTITVD